MVMEKLKKNKIKLVILAIILLIYVTLCLRVYGRFIAYSQEVVINSNDSGNVTEEIRNGDTFVQSINDISGRIQAVCIVCDECKQTDVESGVLEFELLNKENGNVIANSSFNISEARSGQKIIFNFGKIVDFGQGLPVEIRITAKNISDDTSLKLKLCDADGNDFVAINGAQTKDSLYISVNFENRFDALSKISLIGFTMLGILIIITYYFMFISEKQIKVHNMYLIFAIILGSIFLIIIPEYATPDEEKHITTAYGITNKVLGGRAEGYIQFRECDWKQNTLVQRYGRQEFDEYIHALGNDYNVKTHMVGTSYKMLDTQNYLYFFPALGIGIGRVLNFGTVPTFFLGSLFNYILFVVLCYYAIKKIPFGKVAMMIIGLLPMTLQQATSYSYDCPIIAMSFVIIALSLSIALEEKVNRRDIIALIVVTIFFLPVKGFSYAPILLIEALPLKRLYKENRKIFKMLLGGLVLAVIFAMIAKVVAPQQGGSDSMNGFVEWANAPGYTIGYLISNPYVCLCIFWDTITTYGSYYYGTIFGSSLGWLNINLPWLIIDILAFMVLIAGAKTEDEKYDFSIKSKIMFGIMVLLSVGCVAAAMLLDWTPLGSTAILGVQGRYFIPVLMPILFVLRTNYIKINKKILSYCIFMLAILQPFILLHILEAVQRM